MMSNPPQYYGIPNGFPSSSNEQILLQQQQGQFQTPQTATIKGATMLSKDTPPPVMNFTYQQVPPGGGGSVTSMSLKNGPQVMGQYTAPQQQQQRAGNWAITNGSSKTSSRTSSPALLGNNGMPPVPASAQSGHVEPAPAASVGVPRNFPHVNNNNNNNNLLQTTSSQSEPQRTLPTQQGGPGGAHRPPTAVSNNGYNLSPNNNWSGGTLINTPPKSASGMSIPLNASTPTLAGPALAGQQQQQQQQAADMQKLSASVQDLNLNRPLAQQLPPNHLLQQPQPQPQLTQQLPAASNGSNEANHVQTNGPLLNHSAQPVQSHPTTYGHLPPPLNQQQMQTTVPQAAHTLSNATMSVPESGVSHPPHTTLSQQRPPLAGMAPPTATAGLPGQPLNKRPMYPPVANTIPQQPLVGQPLLQQTNLNYITQGGPQQQLQTGGGPPMQSHQPHLQHQQQYFQQQQQQQQPQSQQHQQQPMAYGAPPSGYPPNPSENVVRSGFNRMWGNNTVDLLQNRHVLPTDRVRPPTIHLVNPFQESINCNPDIFRCTLTKIPETSSLLQKSRLPLGVLIHPFRDLNNLPVISCNTIVRCRVCRTYINPFVFFVDSKKWKCNLCYRVNELPEEFQYDPLTKTYGDPTRRPEIKSSTIEFIAPSEYMLRPPQPAIYLFLLDVSSLAQQCGYLHTVCNTLVEHLDNLPGDARTQVGFIAYNSAIHFYNIAEGYNQPHEVTVLDVEDVFLPYPDNLLVNLKECKELIKELLKQLPKRFANTHDTHSALGAALQVAFKLMSASGGRVTVFQTCLPNHGPGALQSREDPNNRSSKEVAHLGPATDFYKRLALECSGQQIAVDLFILNSQYCDLATISGISKFSGGCMHHIPLYNETKPQLVKTLRKSFERYLTRKIGFEAVMRVRCTRGLAIHTFHGNFFVRSTDLLSLPNVNPDAGFGMQITYEESLAECKTVCFQAALLYTSSKAERRIRVHTLCIPVTASLTEVMYSADVQCIIGLLSKMAVDRSLSTSLSDARDAFINATVDIYSAFKIAQNLPQNSNTIVAPENLALLPLYILALLKHPAFRTGTSTRLDDRVFAMCEMKTLPLDQLMRYIYPDFYVLDSLFAPAGNGYVDEGQKHDPPRLQLSAEKLDSRSMFLLDCGPFMFIYIGSNVASSIVRDILGYNSVAQIPDFCIDLPSRDTPASEALLNFLDAVNEEKPYSSYVQVIRDTSQFRSMLVEKFVDDRNPNSLSYYEFLQHLRTQIK